MNNQKRYNTVMKNRIQSAPSGPVLHWHKEAAQLTDWCFDFIIPKIKPGVTEPKIAHEIENFFRKNGAECAFPPIVAFGSHSCEPHYAGANNPTSPLRVTKLNGNDIVFFQIG